jgi:membrane protein
MGPSNGSASTDDAPADPDAARLDADVSPEAAHVGRVAAASARVAKVRSRARATTAGEIQRRATELNMMNQAAILSALAMVLVVPALVTVAAVLPLGSDHGLAAAWARHLALSAEASADVRKLFITNKTVQASTTAFSSLFTIVSAYAWPAELQKSFGMIWGVHSRGVRDLWRPILWVPSLFCALGAVAASGAVAPGPGGALLTGLVGFPVILGWTWWTQHFLLSGRVRWRALLPGAVATTSALLAMSVLTSLFLSGAITYNYDRYGTIGVVFVMMSWLTAFSLVMLGGALVGHTVWRRHGEDDLQGPVNRGEEPT